MNIEQNTGCNFRNRNPGTKEQPQVNLMQKNLSAAEAATARHSRWQQQLWEHKPVTKI